MEGELCGETERGGQQQRGRKWRKQGGIKGWRSVQSKSRGWRKRRGVSLSECVCVCVQSYRQEAQ